MGVDDGKAIEYLHSGQSSLSTRVIYIPQRDLAQGSLFESSRKVHDLISGNRTGHRFPQNDPVWPFQNQQWRVPYGTPLFPCSNNCFGYGVSVCTVFSEVGIVCLCLASAHARVQSLYTGRLRNSFLRRFSHHKPHERNCGAFSNPCWNDDETSPYTFETESKHALRPERVMRCYKHRRQHFQSQGRTSGVRNYNRLQQHVSVLSFSRTLRLVEIHHSIPNMVRITRAVAAIDLLLVQCCLTVQFSLKWRLYCN